MDNHQPSLTNYLVILPHIIKTTIFSLVSIQQTRQMIIAVTLALKQHLVITLPGNTMKMLNFPLLAGLNGAFAYGANLQASLTSMISSNDAYTSSTNGTLHGVNAINLVMDQDTVPDSIASRAMCPWTGTQSPNFVMNYYNAPLAYGVILAMEAGTPYVLLIYKRKRRYWSYF